MTDTAPTHLVDVDALGPGGEYRTRTRETITDTAGVAAAELSIVPPLYVARTISTQRKTRPLPFARRQAALTATRAIFTDAVLAGLDFEQYVALTSRVAGLPIGVARAGATSVAAAAATAFDSVAAAMPTGTVADWRDERTRTGAAVWTRRGEVFAVHASGNAPGIHGLWLQALALGYRVAVRPSRREPFTGHRLILALRAAGFRDVDIALLPTDYTGADAIIRDADLAMVYGDQDVVDKYATDPRVFTNGPGRTKILVTADRDWRDYLDVIVESIAGLGGTACVNTTAVLYEGDPAPLAHAVAERLSAIAPLPDSDELAVLPTRPIAEAEALAAYLGTKTAGATAVLGADQVVADLGGGRAALRPAVHLLSAPNVEQLNIELAFPCVWIAPWSRTDGLAPLRNSLVLNVITGDEDLLDSLICEPTITNVHSGRHLTQVSNPEMPHDGYLADFLMRNKAVIRD
ncbi:acyl-CoA reductase [Mycolicibacterium komossense]|uniref:Aldehyde dehydrogenase family protein n=1 Tax=Mycolicibacterium komossense TaxID=1779 RepID=A0ABT3C4R6_9MYCO|nr:acyl-CoA reductase [Mycolicibacterium komossense]MCV7224474.1 aldehyde dehydrogenase family protein [Mycolicibacterium komossense]